MEPSQRRAERFPFSALATLEMGGAVASTHVTELSKYGCYLECAAPLATGARVTIKIVAGGQSFEAKASVVYARPNLGIALAFREVLPASEAVLEGWLQDSLDIQNSRPSIDDSDSNP